MPTWIEQKENENSLFEKVWDYDEGQGCHQIPLLRNLVLGKHQKAVVVIHSVVVVAANPFSLFSIPPLIVLALGSHDHRHNRNHYVIWSENISNLKKWKKLDQFN